MKRQINTQQVKEHDKCPPNQTKEEKIGSLPEKEFRIMIVKMTQNLETKMELQINSRETRIEKMQEKFNKDLGEIKKSQSIMNNAINEIKNTLEGTNSRIMEAEDRISEVEDSMVEINEAEWKKEKRIKRNEDKLRALWVSWTWGTISFPILWTFSTIISSSIFPWPFFLSSSSGTHMI